MARFVNGSSLSVLVASGSALLLNANNQRHSVALVNSGLVDVWVTKGLVAVVGSGILLKADGGTYTDDRNLAEETIYTGSYAAITVSGTANVGIQEDYYDLY